MNQTDERSAVLNIHVPPSDPLQTAKYAKDSQRAAKKKKVCLCGTLRILCALCGLGSRVSASLELNRFDHRLLSCSSPGCRCLAADRVHADSSEREKKIVNHKHVAIFGVQR
jgi:hypothetical protein